MLVGKQTREQRDIDIDFDATYTNQLMDMLVFYSYSIATDLRPVRIELYHPKMSYIDIHPFILSDDGTAKQTDMDGGWYEFQPSYFSRALFEGRNISCISGEGKKVFHIGCELCQIDKHNIKNIESLLKKP